MANHVGKQLGDYRILEPIGAGGMGEVYLAEHVHLRKKYALKILPVDLANDKGFVDRFHDEARVMAELRHEHIVQVHHMGCADNVYFLAMDYVTGPEGQPLSLHDHLKQQPDGRLPEAQVRKWAVQMAEALAYAHERGIVHRDLKPANILIDTDGDAKLTDFGLAKAIGQDFILTQIHQTIQQSLCSRPTLRSPQRDEAQDTLDIAATIPEAGSGGGTRTSSASSILGTYDYMAPEQRGEGAGHIDQRTDIYSFGVVLYRLLTGKRPTGFAKAPSQSVAGLSRRWDAILRRCIADNPGERYTSAAALMRDLRSTGPGGRQRRALAVAAAAVLLVAVGIWALSRFGASPPDTQSAAPVTPVDMATRPEERRETGPPAPVVDPNQQKLDQLDALMAKAKRCKSFAGREEGLAAVREALLLFPDDPVAITERERIAGIEDPAVVTERERRHTFGQLIASAKRCTSYADRERGITAVREALLLSPDDPVAITERERIAGIEDPAVVTERERRHTFKQLIAAAKRCTSYADRERGMTAVHEALSLYASDPAALAERNRIASLEDPAMVAEREKRWEFDKLLNDAKACTTWLQRHEGLKAIERALRLYPEDPRARSEERRLKGMQDPTIGPLTDNFENDVLDSRRWLTGSSRMPHPGYGFGNWSHSVKRVSDGDGHVQLRVNGPRSGITYGAEAWITGQYDLNDGNWHTISFTWKADVNDNHYNHYFIQITDAKIPKGKIARDQTDHTRDFLMSKEGTGRGTRYRSDTPKQSWVLFVDPAGSARLTDSSGSLVRKTTLDSRAMWFLRLIVFDATSAGFPAGDSRLNLFDVRHTIK